MEAFPVGRVGMQALGGPVVVGVAGVEFFVRVSRQTAELRAEGPLADLGLLVALLFPPLGAAVLEPNLGTERERNGKEMFACCAVACSNKT